jgi:hypothetical protein
MPSIPANPDILSFVDLPAEIRNLIYEIYFRHEDPLYLAETSGSSVTLLKRWHSNFSLEKCRTFKPDFTTIVLPRWLVEVCILPAFQPGLQLLRVCHQIHQEAASVLYSNEFRLVPKFNGYLLRYHDTTGYYMNRAPTSWLRQIGQHNRFVRKLCVDLGSICPLQSHIVQQNKQQTFRSSDGFLQIGPLLGAVWASDGQMVVRFIDNQPGLHCQVFHKRHQQASQYTHHNSHTFTTQPRDVERFNTVFQALCNDALGMRKFRRAIRDVGITADGSWVASVAWTPITKDITPPYNPGELNPLLRHARFFRTEKDGTLCFIRTAHPRLLALPRPVLDRIMKHTLHSSLGYEVDLDSCRNFKEVFGILYTNKSLHNRYKRTFLENTFHLSTMTTDAHAILNFDKLKRLLQTEFKCPGGPRERTDYLHFGANVQYSITINISSNTPSLSTIRINLMSLVAATFTACASRPVRILLHTIGTDRTKLQTTSICTLRRILLKALTKYVKFDCQYSRARCPEVWINGYGTVAEVVETGVVDGLGARDLTRGYCTLWSEEQIRGVEPDFEMPSERDMVRKMYLWLKWVVMRDEGKDEL